MKTTLARIDLSMLTSNVAILGALTSMSWAQEVLPFPPQPSGSIAGRTIQESNLQSASAAESSAQGRTQHHHCPHRRRRPRANRYLRRRNSYTNTEPHRAGGYFLQSVSHHRHVFAYARCAFDRTQPSARRRRPDRRTCKRLGRLLRHPAQDERHDGRGLEGLRLQHRRLGQMAQHSGRTDNCRRPV
jgi:hypothetical protein